MKAHLPALLVLSLCAGGWSCSSSDTSVPGDAATAGASGSMGLAGTVGIAGSGTVATGGSVGAAGASSALGGSTSAAGTGATGAGMAGSAATSGAGTAGSSTGGVGTAGTGSSGTNGMGGSGVGGGTSVGGSSAGGSSSMGGSAAGGGSSTGGGPSICVPIANTATRPQLNSTDAANYTIVKYLAQSDNWDPTAGLGSASSFTPNFTVAADGSGTHTTVQAAINAAASGTARRYILIKPGSYRGVVSYSGSTPITLYGLDSDATKVVIVNNASAAAAGGTDKSATFTSKSAGLQLLNLTVSNDFATPATGTNIQAVALYVTGDKTVLQNVRLHGFQDTLFTDIAGTAASRVYIKDSFVEGDTDFIFGAATLVIDGSVINYLSSRKAGGGGACLAPSTRVSQSHGFLVIDSQFTAAAGAPANKVSLGRSWDEGGVTPTPNGQAIVRESALGAHIRKVDPWAAAATSGRAFSATGNRFFEYCNSGVGSGP